MKINNFGYLMKEGIRGIFLHGFMSFAAVCVTVACLLIVGLFSCLVYNLNIMVEKLNQTNEVIVYVKDELSFQEAQNVGTSINHIGNVQEAVIVDRTTALKQFGEKQNTNIYDEMPEDTLQHRYHVTLMDNKLLPQTVKDIQAIPGVDEVVASYELAKGFSAVQDVLHIVSVLVIGILLLVSLLIISNTVKLAMYDRKDEIAIMKMVGATNGFIRLPFVVEGFTLGMTGAAIAFGVEWILYDTLVARIEQIEMMKKIFQFAPFTELLWPMIATFVAAGMFVGVVGSWTSIRKFMDV